MYYTPNTCQHYQLIYGYSFLHNVVQYKGNIKDKSMEEIKIERNFFETSHGKNVFDGLGYN